MTVKENELIAYGSDQKTTYKLDMVSFGSLDWNIFKSSLLKNLYSFSNHPSLKTLEE